MSSKYYITFYSLTNFQGFYQTFPITYAKSRYFVYQPRPSVFLKDDDTSVTIDCIGSDRRSDTINNKSNESETYICFNPLSFKTNCPYKYAVRNVIDDYSKKCINDINQIENDVLNGGRIINYPYNNNGIFEVNNIYIFLENGKQQNLFRLQDFHGSLLFSFADTSLKTDISPKQLSIPYVFIKDSDITKIQGKNILAEYTPLQKPIQVPSSTQAPTQAPTLPFSFGFQNMMPFSFSFQNMMFQTLSVNDQINTIKPLPVQQQTSLLQKLTPNQQYLLITKLLTSDETLAKQLFKLLNKTQQNFILFFLPIKNKNTLIASLQEKYEYIGVL